MIALDTNILVYAHRRESAHHSAANALLKAFAEGDSAWAIPWPCVYEFLSVVTNPRIWKDKATTPAAAWTQTQAWTASPSISLLGETSDFLELLSSLIQRPRVRGAIVHDARVAAICLSNGVEKLFTRDRDFALFPELRTSDPFAVSS